MRIISADTHMDFNWLPVDLFRSNASSKNRDQMPYVGDSPQGKMWFTAQGQHLGRVGQYGDLGESPRWKELASTGLFDDGLKGILRPGVPLERVKDLDLDGVSMEAIYGPISLGLQFKEESPFVEAFQIFNDWLWGFERAVPDRFIGIANIPMTSVTAAVDEVKRASQMGFVAGHIPMGKYIHPLYDPYWLPLWEEFAQADMVICHHPILNPFLSWAVLSDPNDVALFERRTATVVSVFQIGTASFIGSMIFSGVLDKLPSLKIVVAESGLGWLPYYFERIDMMARNHVKRIGLKRPPSDYFGTNFHVCYQSEPKSIQSFINTYPDNVMFASDYPHPDGVWPFSRKFIDEELSGLPHVNREKVLWRNAARVFRVP